MLEFKVRQYKKGKFVVVLREGKRISWRKWSNSPNPEKKFTLSSAKLIWKTNKTLTKSIKKEFLGKVYEYNKRGKIAPSKTVGKYMIIASTVLKNKEISASSDFVTVGSISSRVLSKQAEDRLYMRISEEVNEGVYDKDAGEDIAIMNDLTISYSVRYYKEK